MACNCVALTKTASPGRLRCEHAQAAAFHQEPASRRAGLGFSTATRRPAVPPHQTPTRIWRSGQATQRLEARGDRPPDSLDGASERGRNRAADRAQRRMANDSEILTAREDSQKRSRRFAAWKDGQTEAPLILRSASLICSSRPSPFQTQP